MLVDRVLDYSYCIQAGATLALLSSGMALSQEKQKQKGKNWFAVGTFRVIIHKEPCTLLKAVTFFHHIPQTASYGFDCVDSVVPFAGM